MFAGGSGAVGVTTRRLPLRVARCVAVRSGRGAGPSGTTAALVIVALASLSVVRFSQAPDAAAAPSSANAIVAIMMASWNLCAHAITQILLDPVRAFPRVDKIYELRS